VVDQTNKDALELACARQASWLIGDLAAWRRRAGLECEDATDAAAPYRAQLAGDGTRAAELWGEMGCPYEAALALADVDEEEQLRRAHAELQALDAGAAVAIVARRLRDLGARGVPRGPRRRTRENPLGLTAREHEVLLLLADGRRNAEIAERLFLTEKTVTHHVSAVLRKLEVTSRGEAAAKAVRLGIVAQAG
jgi:DNA-binding CsgD family transcriptional regulator